MPNRPQRLDCVFRALADPTRRAVVRRLSRGPAAVSELAEPFDMALPSFLQHLDLLEGCGLVRSRKAGRVRMCELAPGPLRLAEGWMAEQRERSTRTSAATSRSCRSAGSCGRTRSRAATGRRAARRSTASA